MAAKKIKIRIRDYGDEAIMQTYVQPDSIRYRVFVPMVENEWGNSEVISEDQLWTNDNLKTKNFVYNNVNYGCTYDALCTLNNNMLEPYREITAVITQGAMEDRTRNDRMFFADRLGDTYHSKIRAGDYARMLRVYGARWLYQFIIQPGTDLTTAPVLALETRIFLTNIQFDESYVMEDINFMEVVRPWRLATRPTLQISGPDTISANGTATFSVQAYNSDGTLNTDNHKYLIDCKQGYAPKAEIDVVYGTATFDIMALGLKAGDTLRFKINDKVWTDYAEKTLTVVS